MDEDLRTWLLAIPGVVDIVDDRVHQDVVPPGYAGPYIWYGRSGVEFLPELNGSPGEPFREFWDVEIYGEEIAELRQLAQLVRNQDSYSGTFGGHAVQAVFTEDHTDDYIPRADRSDDQGRHGAALQLQIVGYG